LRRHATAHFYRRESWLKHPFEQNGAQNRIAILSALTALLFWGGTAVTNKFLLDFLDASDIAIVRTWLAGVFAAVLIGLARTPFPAPRTERVPLIAYAISVFVLWPLLLSAGLARTSASHAAIIMAFLPILTILVSSAVSGTRPKQQWWLGSGIAVVAAVVFLIDTTASAESAGQSSLAGDLIVLAGCLFAAIGYVLGGRVSHNLGARAATLWGLVVGMLVVTPVAVGSGAYSELAGLPAIAWANLAWLSFLSSFLAYLLWYHATALMGVNRTGTMLLLLPAVTLLGANLFLDEPLSLRLIAGCAAVVVGTAYAHKYAA